MRPLSCAVLLTDSWAVVPQEANTTISEQRPAVRSATPLPNPELYLDYRVS